MLRILSYLWPWKKRPLLTSAEAEAIEAAIRAAEKRTSGEIRVVVEKRAGKDPMKKAVAWFERLGMHRTQQRNGVLIYVGLKDRRFAIVGDEGIHRAVEEGFWNHTAEGMRTFFQQGRLVEGIIEGVRRAGEALARYFPYDPETDVNELPDTVIY